MHSDLFWVSLVVLLAGIMTTIVCAAIAKRWLSNTIGYQPHLTPNAARRNATNAPHWLAIDLNIQSDLLSLGLILNSFYSVRTYAEERRRRNEPTTVATLFWVGMAFGIVGVFGMLAAS